MAVAKTTFEWKKYAPKAVVVIYIIFSLIFIGKVMLETLEKEIYNVGMKQGRDITLAEIIQKTRSQCQQPLVLSVGKNESEIKAEIFSTHCLQQANEGQAKSIEGVPESE